MKQTKILVTTLLTLLTANSVWADQAALTQRIERLERIIQGQGLVSLLTQVDQLQSEVQRLNGENESLQHQLETMQKRQRTLYLDLDQRLQQQLSGVPATAQVSNPSSSGSNATTPTHSAITDTPQAQRTEATENRVAQPNTLQLDQSTPVAVENGEAAYQAALQTLRSGQYQQAITELKAFPQQYPHSQYLPNVYYWQGEANYVLRDFDKAIAAFEKVVTEFASSSKVADATLKLGFSQYEKGQVELAKTTLAAVIQNYPDTSAARLAKVRLDRIKRQAQ